MSRSRVLTGQLNQRDRAQLRGRLDGRKQESAQSPVDELRAWLTAELSVDDVSEAETLDLTEFLRNTGQIDLPPDERLRQLAVFLEPDLCSPQPRGWLALDRIYQQAIRIAPKSVWAHHSRALSAKYCAEGLSPNDDGATFRRILDSAWDAANTAYDLDSTDADVSYLMGSLYYIDPVRSVDEALEFFEESIEKDADHQWALLYRAHCLQDLERWTDATSAYDNVNPAYFVGAMGMALRIAPRTEGVLSLSIGRQDRSDCSVPACSGSMDSEPESGVRRDGHLHFRSRKRRIV